MKNIKDLMNEEQNHPIKWTKAGLKGALIGGTFGYMWFLGGPTGRFEMGKLEASSGMRKFSFRPLR